ncbi:hypothetical protein ACFQY9_18005 [Microvirga aerilata]|uniref:hypothetical protein n=1 Tax=Microvirga aerilata TaxID=670292 RepID=UPI0036351618
MSEDFVWSLAADVATVGATAIAAIGLIWTALSLRASTRASDLNSLFLMTGHITAAEARLFASRDDPIQQDVDFNNYLNMLETLAAAINGGCSAPSQARSRRTGCAMTLQFSCRAIGPARGSNVP